MGYEGKYGLDDFELYRRAREFKAAYQVIGNLPVEERYCLGAQMRRAAISITNNIAEGHGRWYYQENIRFCRISRGSVEEIVDDLNACIDESYGERGNLERLKSQAYELIPRINSYIAYLKKTQQGDELS